MRDFRCCQERGLGIPSISGRSSPAGRRPQHRATIPRSQSQSGPCTACDSRASAHGVMFDAHNEITFVKKRRGNPQVPIPERGKCSTLWRGARACPFRRRDDSENSNPEPCQHGEKSQVRSASHRLWPGIEGRNQRTSFLGLAVAVP